MPPGVGPPTSAWWARLAAKPSSRPSAKQGRDQGDVGQVGAAAVGVVEDPEVARPLLDAEHRRDRVGHRAEVDRDVLRLHHQLAGGVEQRRRAVVALLDVGRVRGADQHRAHLLAGRAQRADQHLQRDRVERGLIGPTAPRRSFPRRRPRARHPGGQHEGRLGKLERRTGPSASRARAGLAAQHLGLEPLAAEAGPARARSSDPGGRCRGSSAGPGSTSARRMLTSSTAASGSR